MHVEWAFLCRYAESDGQSATIVGAGIDLFMPPSLPTPLGVMAILKLVGSEEEWSERRRLGFKVLGPDAGVVREETVQVGVTLGPQLFPTYERGAIIVTAHQFEATEAGAYSVEIASTARTRAQCRS